MEVYHSFNPEFDDFINRMRATYGEAIMELSGLGVRQLDVNGFSKRFFNDAKVASDISVDANANVTQKTAITYDFEMPKALQTLNGLYMLWKQLCKNVGKKRAERLIERHISGDYYINDSSGIQKPYCYNFNTYDIALMGLKDLVKTPVVTPPKSLNTFIKQLEQFIVPASNSIMGATGIGDTLLITTLYVQKILDTGYDHKIYIGKDSKVVGEYVAEQLATLIYSLNWQYRGAQSAFTNISVYDREFLKNLCPEYELFGYVADPEIAYWVQELYLSVFNEEFARNPIAYPVLTVCISVDDKKREPMDMEFVRMVATKNLNFCFMNFFTGPPSALSSCCRLRSDKGNPYINSFGGGAGGAKIGSIGVVTANIPRLAVRAIKESVSSDKVLDKFFDLLIECYWDTAEINHARRCIVNKRIDLGAIPIYTAGFASTRTQFSTFGFTGLNEAIHVLGCSVLDEKGQAIVDKYIDVVDGCILQAQERFHTPHNCEQTPSENSAVKLAKKDMLLGMDLGVRLYSNQWIPLIETADMLDRIKLAGMWDKKLSGGSILHINVDCPIKETDKMVNLILYCIKAGVIYFAINYELSFDGKHVWAGKGKCPVCGSESKEKYTRVVGFFTPVASWSPERRKYDWPNRQFYHDI